MYLDVTRAGLSGMCDDGLSGLLIDRGGLSVALRKCSCHCDSF